LAILGPKRLPDLPDVPTCLEKGYAIDLDYWWYLAAAKGTPKPILDILLETFKKTVNDSQVNATLIKAGFTPLKLTPEETENKCKWLFDLAGEIFKKTGSK
jgi:tripartite-type tricarboxylate transporter receptor subunit TctC